MAKGVPDDFGGLLGYWLEGRAVLSRYAHGEAVDGVVLSPLNLLQARKTIESLIDIGVREGTITAEHQRQSHELPLVTDLDRIMPREQVDGITGPG